jgi:peptidyl-prolyl cis-trans isomerase SurA
MSRVLTGLLCTLLLSTGAAWAQTRDMSSTGVALDRVIAIVNEGLVLQSQLDAQSALIADRLQSQGSQLPPADVIRQQVLERLILQEIQVQRAERLGVQVPDEMLNEALRDVAKRNNIEFEQMPSALEQQGVDYATYREEMRREIMLSMLRQRDVFPRIYVSPREVEQALERDASQAGVNTEYDVSHILLSLPESATTEEMTKVEALARDIHDRAAAGEDFGQLALAYSKAQSALERGKLGWRRMGQLPQFIGDLVMKMESGDVSEPVRTPTGFHIVRLDGTRGGDSGPVMVEQLHARHVLMRPNEVQDDATTRQRLAAIRGRILAGEDFAALASVRSEDPGSASRGGDLGWTSPGTFDPAFEEVLTKLQPDEISEPFRTQFGWHIVQLLGRRTYDQRDELRRQRVVTALRESKVDEETELWLRRLRDEAYVEIRNP